MGREGYYRCQVDHAGDVGKCANEKTAKEFNKCVHDSATKRDKCEKAAKSDKPGKDKSDKNKK